MSALAPENLVVAGPSCSGKSRFIAHFVSDQGAGLRTALDIPSAAEWNVLISSDVKDGCPGRTGVIYHYDLARPLFHRKAIPSYSADPALALLGDLEQPVVVTIWDTPEVLRERVRTRLCRRCRTQLRERQPRLALQLARRIFKRYRLYGRRQALAGQYTKWHEYCAAQQVCRHWLVRSTDYVPEVWEDANFTSWDSSKDD